jgi:hypothetical protein
MAGVPLMVCYTLDLQEEYCSVGAAGRESFPTLFAILAGETTHASTKARFLSFTIENRAVYH